MGKENKIIVLDFGGQYTHLLARRIRQLKVFSEIMLPTAPEKELQKAKGIILGGGPSSVYEGDAPKFNKKIFTLGLPVLGLCYGQQLMAQELGGNVKPGKVKEYGKASLEVLEQGTLFKGLGKKELVWMSHGDKVEKLPEGFKATGSTTDCKFAAIADEGKKLYGLQFHPEVTHTEHGLKMLENFVFKVCNCKADWTIKNFAEEKIKEIRKQVGKKKVFLMASGGVDSTVVLALLEKAVGQKKIVALHVDHGLMRKNESAQVKEALEKIGVKELKIVNAGEKFLKALEGTTDPEKKREIIGNLFVEVADKEIRALGLNEEGWLLGQGTIYPDTIETQGTKHSARIKTHHNQVELIKTLTAQGKVIEPIRELYKDEVRELGLKLGLPKKIVSRQPFPGPGLGIRILCSNGKQESVEGIEGRAKKISATFGFNAKILPVKAVGVQGDSRTYRFVVALGGNLDWKKLDACSTRLTNELKEVNRVVFTLFPEKTDNVKLVEAYLSRERISLLQEADAITMQETDAAGLTEKIWQFPVVLLPLNINGKGQGIVLRPVFSTEAMTAEFAAMDERVLKRIVEKISLLQGVGAVFFDVTHKPPATIEWE